MNKWTQFREQKPPEGEYVLLLGYFGTHVRHKNYASYHNMICVGVLENDDPNYPDWCYIPSMHVDVPQEIIAWMPLPEKPKGLLG